MPTIVFCAPATNTHLAVEAHSMPSAQKPLEAYIVKPTKQAYFARRLLFFYEEHARKLILSPTRSIAAVRCADPVTILP